MDHVKTAPPHWALRLPFYYGWLIVAGAFVTMAIVVTARTAFSLLLPPLIAEFGWDRGLVAGAFSFGFLKVPKQRPSFQSPQPPSAQSMGGALPS